MFNYCPSHMKMDVWNGWNWATAVVQPNKVLSALISIGYPTAEGNHDLTHCCCYMSLFKLNIAGMEPSSPWTLALSKFQYWREIVFVCVYGERVSLSFSRTIAIWWTQLFLWPSKGLDPKFPFSWLKRSSVGRMGLPLVKERSSFLASLPSRC